ncbi:MAG: hypothetical protein KC646_09140 [Candidatus Cloacimonetes bacterium]|nr:hypothetical protein [Candidatus Cloacimonadota bacterium]
MSTVISANMMLKVSDTFDRELFKTATNVAVVNVANVDVDDSEINGVFVVDIDPNSGVDLTDVNSFVSLFATTGMVSTEGDIVERRRHIVTAADLYTEGTNGLIKKPQSNTRWLEIREDDYGYKSQPYLKSATTINGVTFFEYNEYENNGIYRDFVAYDFDSAGNGLSYKGRGNFDGMSNTRNFWEVPQTNDFDPFATVNNEAEVLLLSNNATVGSTWAVTYRLGSSYSQGSASGDFGNDYRPQVEAQFTVLRALPFLDRGAIGFNDAVEVRVVEKLTWPQDWDQDGFATQFSTENYEQRTKRMWIVSGHGIVYAEENNKSVSEFDQSAAGGHSWGQKFKTVAYRIGNADPVAGDVSIDALKLDENEDLGFDSVHVEVEFGQGSKLYKLVVERPDHTSSEGYTVDTTIAAAIANENTLSEYSFISFDVDNIDETTANVPWRFKVYEFELGTAAQNMVIVTDTPLAADVPVIIDGKRPHVVVHVEVRGEGEEVSNLLFAGSGFSFLGGQHLGLDDDKADIRFDKQEFGNGFVISPNPTLPNGDPSGRYLANVYIDGNDIKEKFTNLISKPNSLSLANVVSELDIEPIPGQTYLYFGPGVETMKDTGSDKVIAVIGVTHVDEGNFGFVYLLKNVNGNESTLDFQGLNVNNNLGFKAVEDHYGHTVQILGFRHLANGQETEVDFNITGDTNAIEALSPSIVQTSEISITVSTDAKLYSFDWTTQVQAIYKLPNRVDGHTLPSAMNSSSLTSTNVVSSTDSFGQPRSFIVSHTNGNHTLVNVFPDHSEQDAAGNAKAFAMDYIYLLESTVDSRYHAYYGPNGIAMFERDQAEMAVHDVWLDFSLTGKPFVEITDVNQVKLVIESDRQFGDYRVFPGENVSPDTLRGAKVFAKFAVDDLVTAFKVDRFDGTGAEAVTKAQAVQGIELGVLDFSAFMNGRVDFDFTGDDLSRYRGQKIQMTELSWSLPGSSNTFKTTDINVTFEFNDQPATPVINNRSGLNVVSVKSVITTDAGKFVEFTFNRMLAEDVYEYPYLVSISEHMEYDPNNMDPNNTSMMPQFIQPIELHAQDDKMRAYFSPADESVIFHPQGSFDLSISQDFGDFQPSGIKSVQGELLPETWMRFGNNRRFTIDTNGVNNLFPLVDGSGYVYEENGQFGDEQPQSMQFATIVTRTANSFTISKNTSQVLKEFRNENGAFSYCPPQAQQCLPLFSPDTTLGSGFYVPAANLTVKYEETFNKFWTGGIEFSNVAIFTVSNQGMVAGENAHVTQKFAFAEGIGLISHSQEAIATSTLNFIGYKSFDLRGYKVGDQQAGHLGGVSGVEFGGVNLEVGLLTGSDFQAPYTLKFKQVYNDARNPNPIAYAMKDSAGEMGDFTIAPLEVADQGQVLAELFFPPFKVNDSPNGIKATDFYTISVEVTDRNGLVKERSIGLDKFQLDAFWFIDLVQEAQGLQLFAGDNFSLLKNSVEFSEANADFSVSFNADGSASIQLYDGSNGGKPETTKVVRLIEDEGDFKDALDFDRVNKEGFQSEAKFHLTTNQDSLELYPGGMYLIEMNNKSRFNQSLGIYALLVIEEVNVQDEYIRFSYVLSDDFDQMSVNFVGHKVNEGDVSAVDNSSLNSKSNYFNNFGEGQCVDLGIQAFDQNTGEYNPERPIIDCQPASSDILVVSDSVEVTRVSTEEDRATAVHSLVLEVAGGADRSIINVYDIFRMESAMHPSALVEDDNGVTTLTLRSKINVEYFDNYCNAYVPHENKTYVARERDNGNDFMFSVNSFSNVRYTSGPNMDPLPQANGIEDCLSRIDFVNNLETRVWSFQDPQSMPDVERLTFRGDFNGTGQEHALAQVPNMEALMNTPIPALIPIQNAISSIDSSFISTREDIEPWELPFEISTDEQKYKYWNFGVSLDISGLQTGASFFFRHSTMFAEGGHEIATDQISVDLGPLLEAPSYGDMASTGAGDNTGTGANTGAGDATGPGDNTSNMVQDLAIYFGPEGYTPFGSMNVVRLRASIPLSRLTTWVDVDGVAINGEGGYDNHGNHDFPPVAFNVQSDAKAFTTTELPSDVDGLTRFVVYSDDGMFKFGKVVFDNTNTGTYTFYDDAIKLENDDIETGNYSVDSGNMFFELDPDEEDGKDEPPFKMYKKGDILSPTNSQVIGIILAEPTEGQTDMAELNFMFEQQSDAQALFNNPSMICSEYNYGCNTGDNGGTDNGNQNNDLTSASFDPSTEALEIGFGTDRPSQSQGKIRFVVAEDDGQLELFRFEMSAEATTSSTFAVFPGPDAMSPDTSGTYAYNTLSKGLDFTVTQDVDNEMDPFTWYKKGSIPSLDQQSVIGVLFAEPEDITGEADLLFAFDDKTKAMAFKNLGLSNLCQNYQYKCPVNQGTDGGSEEPKGFDPIDFDFASNTVTLTPGTDVPNDVDPLNKFVVYPDDGVWELGKLEMTNTITGTYVYTDEIHDPNSRVENGNFTVENSRVLVLDEGPDFKIENKAKLHLTNLTVSSGKVFAQETDMQGKAKLLFVFDAESDAQTFFDNKHQICTNYQFSCPETASNTGSSNVITDNFRVLGIEMTGTDEYSVTFSRDLTDSGVVVNAIQASTSFTGITDKATHDSKFGAGSFYVFENLDFNNYRVLMSLRPEGTDYYTSFGTTINSMWPKSVGEPVSGFVTGNKIVISELELNANSTYTFFFSPALTAAQGMEVLDGISAYRNASIDLSTYNLAGTPGTVRAYTTAGKMLEKLQSGSNGTTVPLTTDIGYGLTASESQLPSPIVTMLAEIAFDTVEFGTSQSTDRLGSSLDKTAYTKLWIDPNEDMNGYEVSDLDHLWKRSTHEHYRIGDMNEDEGSLRGVRYTRNSSTSDFFAESDFTIDKVGGFTFREDIVEIDGDTTNQWANHIREATEVIGFIPSVTLEYSGNAKTYHNVVVVRTVNWKTDVAKSNGANEWMPNSHQNAWPGRVERDIRFISETGEILGVEKSLGHHGYCMIDNVRKEGSECQTTPMQWEEEVEEESWMLIAHSDSNAPFNPTVIDSVAISSALTAFNNMFSQASPTGFSENMLSGTTYYLTFVEEDNEDGAIHKIGRESVYFRADGVAVWDDNLDDQFNGLDESETWSVDSTGTLIFRDGNNEVSESLKFVSSNEDFLEALILEENHNDKWYFDRNRMEIEANSYRIPTAKLIGKSFQSSNYKIYFVNDSTVYINDTTSTDDVNSMIGSWDVARDGAIVGLDGKLKLRLSNQLNLNIDDVFTGVRDNYGSTFDKEFTVHGISASDIPSIDFDVSVTTADSNWANQPSTSNRYEISRMEGSQTQSKVDYTTSLVLYPGITYNFLSDTNIQTSHPFILNNDLIGGNSNNEFNPANVVKTTGAIEFKPDAQTPDQLFFACSNHQRMGWKIIVAKKGAGLALDQGNYALNTGANSTGLNGMFTKQHVSESSTDYSVTGTIIPANATNVSAMSMNFTKSSFSFQYDLNGETHKFEGTSFPDHVVGVHSTLNSSFNVIAVEPFVLNATN